MPTTTLLTRALTAITRHPWAAVLFTLVPVIVLAWPAGSVPTDNSLAVWFVEDDPALLRYQAFLAEFGNDEAVVIAYEAPGGPGAAEVDPAELDTSELQRQRTAAEALAAVDGVDRVVTGAMLVDAVGPEGARGALERVGVAGERGALAVIAWLEPLPDMDASRGRVLDDIDAAAERTLGTGRELHYAGTGVLYEGLNRQTERDGAVFLALAILIMTALLWLFLGSLRATLIALAAPLAATMATTGLVGWMGGSLNVVMATLPALILVIGLADAVHIFIEWFRARRARPPASVAERRALAARVVTRMAVPCLFTSLTTALAFLALASSRMAVIRELGLYAAFGVLAVWALVLVACGAGLAIMDVPAPRRAFGARLSAPLGRMGEALLRRRRAVLIGFGLALAVLAAGAARIVVDTHTLGLLPDDHEVVTDSRWIEDRLGNYAPLEFVIAAREGSVLRPEVMERIGRWQGETERTLPAVDRTVGVADVLELMRVAPRQGEGAVEAAIAGYAAATGDDLSDYLTADRTRTRVTAFVPMGTAREFASATAAIEGAGEAALGDVATIEPAGYLPLYVRIIDYTVSSTLWGLGLAFLGVFVVLGFLLRSWRLVLAAVPPNLFAVAAVFGVMGWTGIPLDIATATVGAIILGIAVDDTVHFLHRYREAAWQRSRAGAEHMADEAVGISARTAASPVVTALAEAGPALVLTSVILVLGFVVLVLAGSGSIAYFGLLISLAIVAALVADLMLLPVLLAQQHSDLGTQNSGQQSSDFRARSSDSL